MSMNSFVPLWSQTPDSTLWEEPLHVRVLFLTMLALQEPDHVVRMPMRRLCKKANLDPDPVRNAELVKDALGVLLAPDQKSLDDQEFQGRRLQEVDGGWLVLNGEHYQQEMKRLMLRMRKTELQRQYRKAESARNGSLGPGEALAVKALENGDEAGAERIIDEVTAAREEVSRKARANQARAVEARRARKAAEEHHKSTVTAQNSTVTPLQTTVTTVPSTVTAVPPSNGQSSQKSTESQENETESRSKITESAVLPTEARQAPAPEPAPPAQNSSPVPCMMNGCPNPVAWIRNWEGPLEMYCDTCVRLTQGLQFKRATPERLAAAIKPLKA